MIKIINLTPHTIRVRDPESESRELVLEPSGVVARVSEKRVVSDDIDGFPVEESGFGRVEGLPDPAPDTFYLVSAMVRMAAEATGRVDVVSPDTPTTAKLGANGVETVRGFVRGARWILPPRRDWLLELLE